MSAVLKTTGNVEKFRYPKKYMFYRVSTYGMALINAMNVAQSLQAVLVHSSHLLFWFAWTVLFLVYSSREVLTNEDKYYYAFNKVPIKTVIKEIIAMIALLFLLMIVLLPLFFIPSPHQALGMFFNGKTRAAMLGFF